MLGTKAQTIKRPSRLAKSMRHSADLPLRVKIRFCVRLCAYGRGRLQRRPLFLLQRHAGIAGALGLRGAAQITHQRPAHCSTERDAERHRRAMPLPPGFVQPCLAQPKRAAAARLRRLVTCEKRGSRLPSRRDHGMISTARGRSASRRIPYTVGMLVQRYSPSRAVMTVSHAQEAPSRGREVWPNKRRRRNPPLDRGPALPARPARTLARTV